MSWDSPSPQQWHLWQRSNTVCLRLCALRRRWQRELQFWGLPSSFFSPKVNCSRSTPRDKQLFGDLPREARRWLRYTFSFLSMTAWLKQVMSLGLRIPCTKWSFWVHSPMCQLGEQSSLRIMRSPVEDPSLTHVWTVRCSECSHDLRCTGLQRVWWITRASRECINAAWIPNAVRKDRKIKMYPALSFQACRHRLARTCSQLASLKTKRLFFSGPQTSRKHWKSLRRLVREVRCSSSCSLYGHNEGWFFSEFSVVHVHQLGKFRWHPQNCKTNLARNQSTATVIVHITEWQEGNLLCSPFPRTKNSCQFDDILQNWIRSSVGVLLDNGSPGQICTPVMWRVGVLRDIRALKIK